MKKKTTFQYACIMGQIQLRKKRCCDSHKMWTFSLALPKMGTIFFCSLFSAIAYYTRTHTYTLAYMYVTVYAIICVYILVFLLIWALHQVFYRWQTFAIHAESHDWEPRRRNYHFSVGLVGCFNFISKTIFGFDCTYKHVHIWLFIALVTTICSKLYMYTHKRTA